MEGLQDEPKPGRPCTIVGKNAHLKEAITHLTEAIEHGKAGHADVATEHAETALKHLTEVKF